ncbi:MAG: hypothetical protein AB8G99_09120 [Planctomycetaceae bacterium]
MSSRSFLIFACIIACAACAGCYRPYGGYGYQRYPQNGYFNGAPYAQPQSIGQPYPGSYTVPGGVVLPPSSSTPYAPGTTPYTAPNSTIIEGGSTIGPDDGWSSQGDGLGPDGFGSGSDTGGVPRPDMFGTDSSGFDSTEPFGSITPSTGVDVTASAFSRPVTSQNRRFGYEKDYSWLKGILSPDPEVPNAYNIQYSMTPDKADDYAGNLVMLPDPRFSQFRSGDIVEVRGAFDYGQTDAWGKPRYRISSIKKAVITQ